ncbi:MAG: electron transfer flavoprotein subunit alpha/FixB family protein [Rhodospirillaceae bacterium]
MAGILVFADAPGGKPTDDTYGALAAARELATALDEPLLSALIGAETTSAAEHLKRTTARVYVAEGAAYLRYTSESFDAAAAAIIDTARPSVVLFTHTLQTREWVPRLAARLKVGLVSDCTGLRLDGRVLVAMKPVYGGSAIATYAVHGAPAMATVRAGAFQPASSPDCGGEVVSVTVPTLEPRVTVLEEIVAATDGAPRLKDAKVIVSGGRGVGGPDNWHYIEEASNAIGAAVGCSRPVADAGWVPSTHQVGLSGTSVSPDLYIAVGISGAVQHLAGIASARTVVAINSDPDAEIFNRAMYGVVGDFREVLPAFVERVRQLRG